MQRSIKAVWYIRDPRGSSLVELMLICAVITILLTRAYLALTGFPQIGGATIHIAHMLWGGLLMLVAALIFFQAADRVWKHTIAVVFGIGFGLFIDEVGKFVTQDNDYFYKPAVAIMYVIFIAILISTRYFAQIDRRPPEEYLYFATEVLARSWMGTISKAERTSALKNIEKSGITSAQVQRLRSAIQDIKTSSSESDNSWRVWDYFWNRAEKILQSQYFIWVIFAAITLQIVSYISVVYVMSTQELPHTFTQWLNIAWQTAVVVLLLIGIFTWLQGKHLSALRVFYYAMLVMLLIGQTFIFATSQFFGLIELSVNIVILAGLHGAIESKTKNNLDKPT